MSKDNISSKVEDRIKRVQALFDNNPQLLLEAAMEKAHEMQSVMVMYLDKEGTAHQLNSHLTIQQASFLLAHHQKFMIDELSQ